MMTARNLQLALAALLCGTLLALNVLPSSNTSPVESQATTTMVREATEVRASIEEIKSLIQDLEGVLDTSELESELAITESILSKIETKINR